MTADELLDELTDIFHKNYTLWQIGFDKMDKQALIKIAQFKSYWCKRQREEVLKKIDNRKESMTCKIITYVNVDDVLNAPEPE